ncbi:hypothetical protein LOC69_22850 [Blastopirellula sp. JC733]|nr:hypothetical protein [Blastopirellula sediminis]
MDYQIGKDIQALIERVDRLEQMILNASNAPSPDVQCPDKYWEDGSTGTKVHLDRARNDLTNSCYRKNAEVHLGQSVAVQITQGVSEATRAIGGALTASGCGVAGVWVIVAGELVRIGYNALKNQDGSIDLKIDYTSIKASGFPLAIDAATAGQVLDSF